MKFISVQNKEFNFKDILMYQVLGDTIVLLLNDENQLKIFSKTGQSKDAPICKVKYTKELENEIIKKMKQINQIIPIIDSVNVSYQDGTSLFLSNDNKQIIEKIAQLQNKIKNQNKYDVKKRWKKNVSVLLAAISVYSAGTLKNIISNDNDLPLEIEEATTKIVSTEKPTAVKVTSTPSPTPSPKTKITSEPNITNSNANSSELLNTITYENNKYYITDLSVYKNTGNFIVTCGNITYDMSEENKLLFASIVASEMGENYSLDDALAICSVVLNRCEISDWCEKKTKDPLKQITYGSQTEKYEFEAYFKGKHMPYLEGAKTGNWDLRETNPEKFEFAYKATEDALHGIRNSLVFTEFKAPEGTNMVSDYHACVAGNNYYANPYDKRLYFGNPEIIPLEDNIIISDDGTVLSYGKDIPIKKLSTVDNSEMKWCLVYGKDDIVYFDNYQDAMDAASDYAYSNNRTIYICIDTGKKIVEYVQIEPSRIKSR